MRNQIKSLEAFEGKTIEKAFEQDFRDDVYGTICILFTDGCYAFLQADYPDENSVNVINETIDLSHEVYVAMGLGFISEAEKNELLAKEQQQRNSDSIARAKKEIERLQKIIDNAENSTKRK